MFRPYNDVMAKTRLRVNIWTYSHDYHDDADDDEYVVDFDGMGDVVVLIDVAYKHTPIKVEVWMVVTTMIAMLVGKLISY